MVRTKSEQKIDIKVRLRDGKGNTVFRELLKEEEFCGHGRQLAILSLEPGDSIGNHRHDGESETYYILSGTGKYNDNGTDVILNPGDCAYCGSGQSHAIENIGDTLLSFVAMIVYA